MYIGFHLHNDYGTILPTHTYLRASTGILDIWAGQDPAVPKIHVHKIMSQNSTSGIKEGFRNSAASYCGSAPSSRLPVGMNTASKEIDVSTKIVPSM